MKSRNSFLYVLFLCSFAMMSLTSCGDIEQDLRINADGSGSLSTTFDIGEMMGMLKGFGEMDMEDALPSDEESDDMPIVPEEPKDPMELIMEKVTSPDYDKDFDTLISLLSIMPDSVREKETRLDLVNKMAIRLASPANSGDLKLGLIMNFDNQAQLKELIKYMDDLDNAGNSNILPSAGPGGMQSESFLVFEADLKAGWIRVDSVDYSNMASEFVMSTDSMSTDSMSTSSEDMGMIEMMFGGTKIKAVVHVPGEVISCTNKDAILTKDNKVIVEYGLMEAVKKGKVEGFTIHFTPVK